MRTKSILLGAAVLAAGVASSMAANVYSVNVVGYVNLSITNGYNLIANPLDADGTNNINTVIPVAPDGTQLLQWLPGIQNFTPLVQYIAAGNGWYDQSFNLATNKVAPGGAFFLFNPHATANVTFVGNVVQGTNTTTVNGGYGFYANIAPVASDLDTNGFPAHDGMQYSVFTNGNYTPFFQYIAAGNGWYDQSFTQQFPTPGVGQGFLLYNPLNANYNWTESFTVQ